MKKIFLILPFIATCSIPTSVLVSCQNQKNDFNLSFNGFHCSIDGQKTINVAVKKNTSMCLLVVPDVGYDLIATDGKGWKMTTDGRLTIDNVNSDISIQIAAKLQPLCFTDVPGDNVESSIKYVIEGNITPFIQITQTPNDLDSWKKWTVGESITLKDGESIYVRNNLTHLSLDVENYSHFITSGLLDASGCVNSMIGGQEKLSDYCFYSLFSGCNLRNAPALPSTELTSNCYALMFKNCTSLAQAPELPATVLAPSCYEEMFFGCSAIDQVPELPATTLESACYSKMFSGCEKLTKATILPAQTLVQYCYQKMFENCKNLEITTIGPESNKIFVCPKLETESPDCVLDMFSGTKKWEPGEQVKSETPYFWEWVE